MIYTGVVFYCSCDICKASLVSYNNSRAFIHKEHLENQIVNMDWRKLEDGKTYCPDCHKKHQAA